jgi:hypothetical protein
MANTVKLKRSSTASSTPASGDLSYGELAINYADGKLFYKNSSDAISEIGGALDVIGDVGDVTLSSVGNNEFLAYDSASSKWINQTALEAGIATSSDLTSHTGNTSNPHSVTATQVSLGDVTNESKATMFSSPVFTGNPTAPTQTASDNSTNVATTAYVDTQVATENTLAEMNDASLSSPGDNDFLVHNGTAWVNESGETARTSLGVDASGTINYTHPNHSGDVTSVNDGATTIANDAVTYAKMQNVSASDRILGRDTAGEGDVEEITPANVRAMINVEAGADVTDTANVVAALSAGTGVTISSAGVVDVSAVALTTVQTAADETAHIALTAQEGDVVVRSDENKSYVHNSGTAGTMADYTLLATPTDAVLSVNGVTGAVTAEHIATAIKTVDGSESGLDADLLDGQEGSYYYAASNPDGYTTDINTNQLTTFTVSASTDTFETTISQGEDLMFTAGTGITCETTADGTVTITNTVTDTTYSNFAGTTAGLVPTSTTGDDTKFLRADGTWVVPTIYTHPTTYSGDDFNVDTGPDALSGATVVSDIDINVTTDTSGHVTDANGSVSTRTLTLADLGYTGATNANYITNNNQLSNGAGYVTAANHTHQLLTPTSQYGLDGSDNGSDFNTGIETGFVRAADNYPDYGSVIRLNTLSGQDGGSGELYFPYSSAYGGDSLRYRLGKYNNAGWTGWKTIIDSSGGSITGNLTVNGGTGVTLNLGRQSGSPNIKSTSEADGHLIMDSNGSGTGTCALNWYSSDDIIIGKGGGNVGIGETSPGAKLHIRTEGADASDNKALILQNYASTPYSGSVYQSFKIGTLDMAEIRCHRVTSSDGQLSFSTYNGTMSEQMRIDKDGNVGIGTSSPDYKLSIHGGSESATTGPHIQATTTDDSYPVFQQLNWRHDNVALNFDSYYDGSWRSSDAGSNFQIYKVSDQFQIKYDSGIAAGSAVTWNTGLVMDTSGNVGIGTSPSSEKLEVSGAIKSISTGAAHLILNGDSNNSGDAGQVDSIIDFLGDGNPGVYGYRINTENWAGQTALHFQEYINGSYTSRLLINKAGNVGIGTTGPLSKFEVYGGSSGVNDVDRYVRFKASNGEKRFDFHIGGTGNASSLDMYQANGTTKGVRLSSADDSYVLNNFGIGTNSPSEKLEVDGNLAVSGTLLDKVSKYSWLRFRSSPVSYSTTSALDFNAFYHSGTSISWGSGSITVDVAGVYLVSAAVSRHGTTTNTMSMSLYHNGGLVQGTRLFLAGGASPTYAGQTFAVPVRVGAGDTLKIEGTGYIYGSTSGPMTYFSGVRIGGL